MSDGSRLRGTWSEALTEAETQFRRLLSANDWKHVTSPGDYANGAKGKIRATSIPELSDVIVHRRPSRPGPDVYRLVLDVPTIDEAFSLEPWKAVLATPELRKEWDPAVEDSHLVEVFDSTTRICKTNFTLGWPANPRDAVTISRTFHDSSTLISISTSLPRSMDEPVYVRPSPPYVRSHVSLFAWCIQHVIPPEGSGKKTPKIRITCFWQHDFKALWGLGTSSSFTQQLCTMMLGLLKSVKKRSSRVPMLGGFGHFVSMDHIRFQVDREALTIEYAIIPVDDDQTTRDDIQMYREQKRLTRSIECVLPSAEGWDVQLSTKSSSEDVEQLPWSVYAFRSSSFGDTSGTLDQIILRITHPPLRDENAILKVCLTIEVSVPSAGLRINGLPQTVKEVEERNPSSFYMSQQMLQDVNTTVDFSLGASSVQTSISAASSSSGTSAYPQISPSRSAAADKSLLSRVKRNYIYFSSLLQEPEAKWKQTTEGRGVSVTQLDSIDPTLVVYRAEATFVGVSLWDLFGALSTPGARIHWDKQHDDAFLLEDVNELSELWHYKTKAAWPANGRDTVLLRTVYKSPTTIHVFAFSADDPHLFPNIPPVEPNVIRTQVDLQGWAIEALSPTTTSLTLLEQSDPKGWTNKTSIPTQMINLLAGIGEFAIRCGGPPVLTRLAGAKATQLRYDHEKSSFKIEYKACATRGTSSPDPSSSATALPLIECELRCDVDNWSPSLDIVVDPPPSSITCLRRHRLSSEGGGLWLTLVHDAVLAGDERLLAVVRKGPGREKGVVMLNGSKVHVDVEQMPEDEIRSLTKQKRVKPARIPLDQPPVVGVVRRRKAEWDADLPSPTASRTDQSLANTPASSWLSPPKISSPLTRFFTYAVDQATTSTQQAVAAISPAIAGDGSQPSAGKLPMQYALEALAWTQEAHPRFASDGWALVSDKGLPVKRKLYSEISPVIPVHKAESVIEGFSAEEIAVVVTEPEYRNKWDDRFGSIRTLESFGNDCKTSFLVSKGGFPFRDRGFYVASTIARGSSPTPTLRRNTSEVAESAGAKSVLFCVSASYSAEHASKFASNKVDPYVLPIGRIFVDAWVLETLDPYTKENYTIPSTRCTRLIAVDYAGSIPAAVNSMINSTVPRSILTVAAFMKTFVAPPLTRLPPPGIVVTEKKGDETLTRTTWMLRQRDDVRRGVITGFQSETKSYRTVIAIAPPSPRSADSATPRPSRLRSASAAPQLRSSSPEVLSSSPPSDPLAPALPVISSSGSVRGKSSSSAFTIKGELRHSTDLLVAELVVESKLYQSGYNIQVYSASRTANNPISLTQVPSNLEAPFACTVHIMPPSSLHSSGLSSEAPTRHLVRLTLPTAQYEIPTVLNPLTGETQSAPPAPVWMTELKEKGLIVQVTITPLSTPSQPAQIPVTFNNKPIPVVDEKQALTSLGRDELLDDRVSKSALLSSLSSETDSIPEELITSIGVAEDLLDLSRPQPPLNTTDSPTPESDGSALSSATAGDHPGSTTLGSVDPSTPIAQNGLLGFFTSYQNPLARLKIQTPGLLTRPSSPAISRKSSSTMVDHPPGHFDARDLSRANTRLAGLPNQAFPLSTLVIVALIAFLIGSLLRSLISPADFIYVATDLKDAPTDADTGWREIRRLFELKYVLGGWDFQVAIVRRHQR